MISLRIKLYLNPGEYKNSVALPIDFRSNFISIIKNLTENSVISERFEKERPGYSPYVFSVNFADIFSIDDQNIVIKPPVIMTISSGKYEVISTICNKAINKKSQLISNSLDLYLKKIALPPLKKIKKARQSFKIYSHAVFRGSNGYLNGSKMQELEEATNYHMLMHHQLLRTELDWADNSSLEPVEVDLSQTFLQKGVCLHYGGQLTTLQGVIGLNGSPESLQFLYDFGIGVRKGQGFGLLGVAR